MKIGLVTTSFPRFEGDHAGCFLATLAEGLVSQGHEVHVLAPEPCEPWNPPRMEGVEVTWVPYLRPRRLQRTFYGSGAPDNLRTQPLQWLGASSFSAALARAVRDELDDADALVSSWCLPCGWVASQLARGRDHLCLCHETDLRWLRALPRAGSVARAIAAGATSLWFLSDAHRRAFAELGRIDATSLRTHVGSMPVARPAPLDASREALRARLGMRRFTLLFLGRLVPVKGVDRLLHALGSIGRAVELRVAGDGPERARLDRLARALDLGVRFEGWARGAHKEALLRAVDALVVPSRRGDGLPTVLFEARARNLPIIASRVGAIGERARALGDVRLVDPDDLEALERAIVETAAARGYGVTRSVPLGGS